MSQRTSEDVRDAGKLVSYGGSRNMKNVTNSVDFNQKKKEMS